MLLNRFPPRPCGTQGLGEHLPNIVLPAAVFVNSAMQTVQLILFDQDKEKNPCLSSNAAVQTLIIVSHKNPKANEGIVLPDKMQTCHRNTYYKVMITLNMYFIFFLF